MTAWLLHAGAMWLLPFAAVSWVLTTLLFDGSLERVVFALTLVIGSWMWLRAVRRADEAARGLLASDSRVQEMADSLDAMIWYCDAEGRVTHASARVSDHFGYTSDEAIGMSLADLVHPLEMERLVTLLAAGGGWSDERFRCIHKDGTERWYVGSGTPVIDDREALIGYVGTTRPLGRDAIDEQRRTAVADAVYARLRSRAIVPVFQPILSVRSGRMIGAEALSRFPESNRNPEQWFQDAADVGLSVELELLAIELQLTAAAALPEDIYISFNVSPMSLARPALLHLLANAPLEVSRLVVEVTEHTSIVDYEAVLASLQAYRAMGVRLAIDDAGAGYASFRHILRLGPEIIKLDRSLVAGIDQDAAKRALAAAVVAFGTEMCSTIVAEGIETMDEFRVLQAHGIGAAQGYLFGPPTADWSTWTEWHEHGPLMSLAAVSRAR